MYGSKIAAKMAAITMVKVNNATPLLMEFLATALR
jgi:hypothetical protein